jgi:GxxExxY protein
LSYLINGCIFDVHNEVGPGVREECYQKALEQRLIEKGIPFIAKQTTRRELIYRDHVVDVFEPDLIIAEQIIPELKHQPEGFAPENFTQLLCYLKFWRMQLGLLANFAMDRAIIERVPYDHRDVPIEEDYEHIAKLIQPHHKPVLHTLREGILELHRAIGVGYPTTTCRKLALVEWRSRGLHCLGDLNVEPTFHERRLPNSDITPFLVEKSVCVQVDAIYDDISARAVRTMQTHLRLMGCEIGLIVCFGKTKLMIRGVRRKRSNE